MPDTTAPTRTCNHCGKPIPPIGKSAWVDGQSYHLHCARAVMHEGSAGSPGLLEETDPGEHLTVCVRPLLVNGMLGTTPSGFKILLSDSQDRESLTISAWHEVVHMLKCAGHDNQDEETVEAAAKKLAATCPEILKWLGI